MLCIRVPQHLQICQMSVCLSVVFFFRRENTTDMQFSTCQHLSIFYFFQHVVVGLEHNFM
jgi:hypothetical protein